MGSNLGEWGSSTEEILCLLLRMLTLGIFTVVSVFLHLPRLAISQTEHVLDLTSNLRLCVTRIQYYNDIGVHFKTWQNWPTLLAKHSCFCIKIRRYLLFIANDSETTNSVCQAMLAKALMKLFKLVIALC